MFTNIHASGLTTIIQTSTPTASPRYPNPLLQKQIGWKGQQDLSVPKLVQYQWPFGMDVQLYLLPTILFRFCLCQLHNEPNSWKIKSDYNWICIRALRNTVPGKFGFLAQCGSFHWTILQSWLTTTELYFAFLHFHFPDIYFLTFLFPSQFTWWLFNFHNARARTHTYRIHNVHIIQI